MDVTVRERLRGGKGSPGRQTVRLGYGQSVCLVDRQAWAPAHHPSLEVESTSGMRMSKMGSIVQSLLNSSQPGQALGQRGSRRRDSETVVWTVCLSS